MTAAHSAPSATLLPGGDVLVVSSDSAERYSPATDSWSRTGPKVTRAYGNATLLPGGQVLVTGGGKGTGGNDIALAEAERYDPATNTWAATAPLGAARFAHSATLLPDGQVLVVGGRNDGPGEPGAVAERYDPATDAWIPAGALRNGRAAHTATLLPDGGVLAVGGFGATVVVERYDPRADRWRPASATATSHQSHAATLLADGQVLVTGGGFAGSTTAAAEVYDPAANRWAAAGSLGTRRTAHVAVRLLDGRVLVAGGLGGANDHAALRVAEVFDDGVPRDCFAETGFCVQGRFLEYWQERGGLARNGFPLSDVRIETLEDGNAYQVQYFERVRMEYHPENAPPYDVLLGQFGRRVLRTQATVSPFAITPTTPRPGAAYFPETGHNLAGGFLAYWQANGGLAQFGYPLTEEVGQALEDGQTYRVQYFERARFEHHPEHAAPYDILLGQFGRRILAEHELLAGVPGFQQRYVTSERVQTVLGTPAGPAVAAPGATQAFEGGRMVWRGDTRRITVLCGEARAGEIVWEYAETWEEGQDPGGGPAPVPGRYLPQRGFGKLWREEQAVRACLGYALTPGETSYPLHAQPFVHGYYGTGNQMLSVVTPEGRFIYVVFDTYLGGSSCISRPDLCVPDYERYPDPAR